MSEKTVSEAISYRRSVRIYDPNKSIDTAIVKECVQQATIAPTSSNLQLWEFYHITNQRPKRKSQKHVLINQQQKQLYSLSFQLYEKICGNHVLKLTLLF